MLASVLAFALTLVLAPVSQAQLLLFFSSQNDSQQVLGWSPNQAYSCGRLLCSNVTLQGSFGNSFTLAKSLNPGEPREEVEAAVEDRADLVESTFTSILRTVLSRRFTEAWINGGSLPERDRQVYRERILGQFPTRTDQDLHPETPAIEVGIENGQTVVFVPAQPEKGLASQTIVTVTELDLLNAGINAIGRLDPDILDSGDLDAAELNSDNLSQDDSRKRILAEAWRDIMRQRLSDALWGQDYDWQYPFDRLGFVIGIAIVTVGLMWLTNLFQNLLKSLRRRLKKQFKELQHSLMQDLELAEMEGPMERDAEEEASEFLEGVTDDPSNQEPDQSHSLLQRDESIQRDDSHHATSAELESLISNPLGVVLDLQNTVKGQFQYLLHQLHRVSLDQQNRIRQQRNLLQLLLRSLFWVQLTLLFTGATLIALIYPASRLYVTFFLTQAIALPTIWMVISIVDIVVDFVSDRYLHQWAKYAELEDPSSNRYALRVSTYSLAIKGATTTMLITLGIYLTILAFGINPSVLASAGVAAVVVAFLSRNLLEDMLNGALILWTDRYAVGDVIKVGDIIGLVENMNLYTTQIRGAEGRLVTIPNGQILIVENLTKDWSRVDFTIEIAHNADVGKALEILQHVSEQMRSEEPWNERILEPASILGVDQVTHAGILIQVWIKTQPIQQFSVGREFRLRIKQAFDEAGIALGIPQREITYLNGSTRDREHIRNI